MKIPDPPEENQMPSDDQGEWLSCRFVPRSVAAATAGIANLARPGRVSVGIAMSVAGTADSPSRCSSCMCPAADPFAHAA